MLLIHSVNLDSTICYSTAGIGYERLIMALLALRDISSIFYKRDYIFLPYDEIERKFLPENLINDRKFIDEISLEQFNIATNGKYYRIYGLHIQN